MPREAVQKGRSTVAVDSGVTPAKLNYLELESDFIGPLEYDTELPVPIADHKQLLCPLTAEVFCGYRPTSLELQSVLHLIASGETGPAVELLDPLSTYSTKTGEKLAPEDAALLVGVVSSASKAQAGPASVSLGEDLTLNSPVQLNDKRNSVDIILDQLEGPSKKIFIHPLKPNLKPMRVLSVLPHPVLSTNKYLQVALQQVTSSEQSAETGLLLVFVGQVSSRLKNFALYEPFGNAALATPQSPPEAGLKSATVNYRFVRDFMAKFPDPSHGVHNNLIFDLPKSLDTLKAPQAPVSEVAEVYFTSLMGPKILFTKLSGATPDGKKHRDPLQLISRPPNPDEEAEEIKAWSVLRDTSVMLYKPVEKPLKSVISSKPSAIGKNIAKPTAKALPDKGRLRKVSFSSSGSSSGSSSSGSMHSSSSSSGSSTDGSSSGDD